MKIYAKVVACKYMVMGPGMMDFGKMICLMAGEDLCFLKETIMRVNGWIT